VRLIDANLLLYAFDSTAPSHESTRTWLDEGLSRSTPTGFAWIALLAFLRISTNPRVYRRPLETREALEFVEGWLRQPGAVVLSPGRRHLAILRELLEPRGAAANLTSDAHLAAIAIEHGAVLCTADRDFARFEGLRWSNPLERGAGRRSDH
jgi:uncharacterized protein